MEGLLREGTRENLEFMTKRRIWGKGGEQLGRCRLVNSPAQVCFKYLGYRDNPREAKSAG
jgi:hypothetical protein